ncbi:MAG: hypothetical protein RR576_09685 [Oscillospiraceae bacterium]
MKKQLIAITILALCLVGCKQDNTSSSKSDITNDNNASTGTTTASQYNIKVTTRQEGALDIYPGKDGIYFAGVSNENAISYYDESTGESTAICNRPECRHSDDSCTAFMPVSIYNLFMNTDKTKLFIQYSDGFADGTTWAIQHIQVCDINGGNRKEIYKSGDNNLGRDFAFSGEEMFFIADTVDKQTTSSKDILIKLNYITGEQNIVHSFEENAKIIGGYDNYILLDLSVGDTGSSSANIVKFNMDTKEQTQLLSYTTNGYEANSIAYANNEKLYFIEPTANEVAVFSVLDMRTNKKTVLNDTARHFGVHTSDYNSATFTSEYMILKMSIPDDSIKIGAKYETYAFNLLTGEQKEINLKTSYEQPYIFLYEASKNYIIYKESAEMPITLANADGTTSSTSVMMSLFGVFDKNDYLNSVDKSVELR